MVKTLIHNWWLFALRSVFAAFFSVMAFMMRGSAETFTLRDFATRGMLVFLGILALAAGASTVAAGIWRSRDHKWWLVVLDGLGVSAAGLILTVSDHITFSTVMYLLALLATVIGFVEVVSARMVRRHIADEWFLLVAGLVSAGCGLALLVVMITQDQPGSTIFVWLGIYSALSAICMMGLALRLRSLGSAIHRMAGSESGD